MAFPALNHVALTIRDMAVSGPWYRRLLGADPVVDEHTAAGFRHLVWILDGGTLLGIHQHEQPAPDERFSEFRAGLDHVGFGCATRADPRDVPAGDRRSGEARLHPARRAALSRR